HHFMLSSPEPDGILVLV
ncbi:hypothetical protein A2U01_0065589, partial [Trifolium medium]|nr:hypothetical protein [Trifolium medium]